MSDTFFEEPKASYVSSGYDAGEGLLGFLGKTGIVGSQKQASVVLVTLALVMFVASIFFFAKAGGPEIKEDPFDDGRPTIVE